MAMFTEPSERFTKLKKRLLAAVPQMCPDRARYYTQSYQETEGEAMVIRRAKAFAKTLENMTIFVADDDLFVGNQASTLRACPVYPEAEAFYMMEEIDIFPVRDNDRVAVSPEVRKELMEEILPYWQDKNSEFISEHRIPEETRKVINVEHQVFSPQLHQRGTLAHTIADYGLILKYGFEGVKEQIQKKWDGLDLSNIEDFNKKEFYDAEIICCDAAITFAKRYAQLLKETAAKEKTNREELNCIRWRKTASKYLLSHLEHSMRHCSPSGLCI